MQKITENKRSHIIKPSVLCALVLSVIACVITFSIRAIVNKMDPFADEDGSKAQAKREKKARRKEKRGC